MKYTVRDLVERATVNEVRSDSELYKIDGHTISLISVWSYGGGRDSHLMSVYVDGKMVATRCTRNNGLRKALAVLNEQ
jgi:hypothetical protein